MTATRRRFTAATLAAALGALVAPLGAGAVETRTVQVSAASLALGESDGVAVTRRGRLFLAPSLVPVGSPSGGAPPYAWTLVADAAGNLFVGTGPEGVILKIGPSGRRTTFFETDEPMVTALAVAADGSLLAGTAPSGKIYRISPDGRGRVWCETGERYVWSLLIAPDGKVFAGTGENGAILEIDREGKVSPFFDTDESHVVQLVRHPGGDLLAGGAGRGLVYRIDAEGHGLVLHDDELPEVTGIALLGDGALAVSLLATAEAEPRPPAVRIRLPEQEPRTGGGAEGMGELEEEEGPTLEGVIEGLPLRREGAEARLRGRVLRIEPDGATTEIWRSTSEAPYGLALDEAGRVVFGTGEPGRVFRVEQGGADVALIATLREAQVSSLLTGNGWLALASSNPSGVYRLARQSADTGVFVSHPIDTGSQARWGSISWTVEGAGGRAELFTRTGNSEVPDATWSAWSPALTTSTGSPIVNPDGRFLQWKLRLEGGGGSGIAVSAVQVRYLPVNRAPEIADFRLDREPSALEPGARFRWRVRDPDEDPLVIALEMRAVGGTEWQPIASVAGETRDGGRWRDGDTSWDTAAVEEGRYEVRARVSDEAANHPGDGRRVWADQTALVTVDRTAPQIVSQRRTAGGIEIEIADDVSGVRRLELLRDGSPRFRARPVDGVCDSARERFRLDANALAGEGWTLRAVDAAGNAVDQPLGP